MLYLVAICSLSSNREKTPTVQAVVEHKLEMQAVCLQSKSCNFYSECKYSSFPAYVLLVATFFYVLLLLGMWFADKLALKLADRGNLVVTKAIT